MKKEIGTKLLKALVVLFAATPFTAVWLAYYANNVAMKLGLQTRTIIVAMFFIIYMAFARTYEAFLISYKKTGELFVSQVLTILMTDGIMFMVLWAMTAHFPNILPALAALAGQLLLALIWTVVARKLYFCYNKPKAALVLSDGPVEIDSYVRMYGMERKFRVTGTMTSEACLKDPSVLDGVGVVFISFVKSKDRNEILKLCVDKGIIVYAVPRLADSILMSGKAFHMFHLPMIQVKRFRPNPEYALIKRLTDIVISSVMLLVLSPVMAAVAIAVRRDGGPALYKQKRLTENGRVFELLKFRSMRVDAEKDGVARLSTGENDDRITAVGHFIRACRLDELPQLINILKNDMSLVGPRPERPEIAAEYEREMPEFRLRLQVKAGLTGYAQVYGKYNTTPYDKLNMDLMYIADASALNDLMILFSTVSILFRKDSTEGVEKGKTSALK